MIATQLMTQTTASRLSSKVALVTGASSINRWTVSWLWSRLAFQSERVINGVDR